VRELATRGIALKATRGRYHVAKSIRAYCDQLRDAAGGRGGDAGATLAAERGRHAREQADHLALKNAQLRRELVPASDVAQRWIDVCSRVRAGVLAVPSRVHSRLSHLTAADIAVIDAELRLTLTELGTA
jgi:phage terminase Nu1 subunit (DNA packaging protein)